MRSYATLLPTLALAGSVAGVYQYGDHKYEELEHLLVDNAGYNDGGFAAAVTPCSRYVNSPLLTTGRETAAQWQRVFFHDVSTGDIHAGTGGVDASIGFETMRAENKGAAMNDTLGWYSLFYNQNVGMADMVALGVTISSASCSGPKLVFKGGRIDATGGGRTGVPEPEQPASEYFEAMEKIGLNKTEGIQFIACGHTIGSVHHSGFPEIQGPETVTLNNTNGGQSFDATVDVYDNSVVTQYLDGTTKNPLVVSFNETNRSDKRIFESDGNITMKDLGRSNAHFLDVCRNIYQKGIDTVPSGVKLFDITPITVKPVNVAVDVSPSGTSTFRGAIRMLGTDFAASTSRKVVIAWKGTDKKEYTTTATSVQTGASTYLHTTNYFYPFSATVKTTGVTSFVVRVTDNGKTTTYDNGGKRFTFTDAVQFQPQLSAFIVDGATNSFTGTIAAAVRSSSKSGPVIATLNIPSPVVGAMNPTLQTLTVPLNKVSSLGKSGYDLYTAQGGPFPLPVGVNITSRSVTLAKQTTLDITMGNGPSAVSDAFRKISEVGLTLH